MRRLFRGETILSAFIRPAGAGCAADIGVEESPREARRVYGAGNEPAVKSGYGVRCDPPAVQGVRKIPLLRAGSERPAGK